MKFIRSLFLAAMFCAGMPNLAAALTVDSFDDSQSAVATVINTPVTSVLHTTKAIGGVRRITATMTAGSNQLTGAVKNGKYNHSQDVGVKGRSLVVWDGDGTSAVPNPTGLHG